jgi:hypothetical protein
MFLGYGSNRGNYQGLQVGSPGTHSGTGAPPSTETVDAVALGAVMTAVEAMANTPIASKRKIFCIFGGSPEGPKMGQINHTNCREKYT